MRNLDLTIGEELTVSDLFDIAGVSYDFIDGFTDLLKSGSASVDNYNGENGVIIYVTLVYLEDDDNICDSVVRITEIENI